MVLEMAAETNQVIEEQKKQRQNDIAVKTPLALASRRNLKGRLNSHSRSTQKRRRSTKGLRRYKQQHDRSPMKGSRKVLLRKMHLHRRRAYFDSDAQTSGGSDALSDMDDKTLDIGHNGLDRQAPRSRSLFTANSEISTE